MSTPPATATASDSRTGIPAGNGRPRGRLLPSASSGIANVPLESPPKMKPYSGPGRPRGFSSRSRIWFVRLVRTATPLAWSDWAALQYSAAPRTIRTARVDSALQRTSRQRTVRTRRPSVTSESAAVRSDEPAAVPSGTVQAIPDAADRLDPIAFGPELGPKVVDVGVDGIGRDGDSERPCLVEQLISAQGLARMTEERFEEGELARTEIHRSIVDRDRPRCLVQADRSGRQARLGPSGRALRATGQGAQPRCQLVIAERLDDIVVGPRIEAGDAVTDRVASGEHQDRQFAPFETDPPRDLQTGQVGK